MCVSKCNTHIFRTVFLRPHENKDFIQKKTENLLFACTYCNGAHYHHQNGSSLYAEVDIENYIKIKTGRSVLFNVKLGK